MSVSIKYRIFTRSRAGELDYSKTSHLLGTGPIELSRIVEGDDLEIGCVLQLGDEWVLLSAIEESSRRELVYDVSFERLPTGMEDTSLVFGNETWSPQLINRLCGQAIRYEVREEEAAKASRRRRRT